MECKCGDEADEAEETSFTFQWPGTTEIELSGNTFQDNGLAFAQGSIAAQEEIVQNTSLERDDRAYSLAKTMYT
jgi:hypothetical protein